MKESEEILNEILEIAMLRERNEKNLNFYAVIDDFLENYMVSPSPGYRTGLSEVLDVLIETTSKQENELFDGQYEYVNKNDVGLIARLMLKIRKLEKEEDLTEKQFNINLLNKIIVLYKIYDKTNNSVILDSLKKSCDTINMSYRKR